VAIGDGEHGASRKRNTSENSLLLGTSVHKGTKRKNWAPLVPALAEEGFETKCSKKGLRFIVASSPSAKMVANKRATHTGVARES
jgi:hypothetical protein